MALVPSFSGGKDSTYMVIHLYEKGVKMDDIVYFDTGWDFPEMEEHIALVEEYIKQKVTVLKPRIPFNHLFASKDIKGKTHKGYGWATMVSRWCTRVKITAINAHITSLTWRGLDLPVTQAIGYAADEQHRIGKHKEKKGPLFSDYCYPLNDWLITENDALDFCKQRGFTWGGLYDVFSRVSCWCCPLGGKVHAHRLFHYYPNLWDKLLGMNSWLAARGGV